MKQSAYELTIPDPSIDFNSCSADPILGIEGSTDAPTPQCAVLEGARLWISSPKWFFLESVDLFRDYFKYFLSYYTPFSSMSTISSEMSQQSTS